ncbi:helix-turn-helix domain-containing protein [Yersinia bercovieri]|uniref:helix-turn-helix domain-containing protein n=1 Tax=Yersinia bercovieri TaxID=634 RepID=UPI0011A9AEDF|nr:helix-turn-helix transcriptional regulator [Yersinia bercovieri]
MAIESSVGEKIRQIREAEGLTRKEFADLLDISYSSLTNYEIRGIQVTEKILTSLAKHVKFKKYALWLISGDTAPEVGQIAPTLSPCGQEETTLPHSDQKIG